MSGMLLQLHQWKGLRTVCGIGGRMKYGDLKKEAQKPDKLAVSCLISKLNSIFKTGCI